MRPLFLFCLLFFLDGCVCIFHFARYQRNKTRVQYSLATEAMWRMVMLHECQPSTWNLPFFTLPAPTGASVAATACMHVARPPLDNPGSDND